MANRFLNNITVNDSYTFPSTDGSSGQAIITDGAGNLTFGSATAASADSTESVHISVKNTSGAQILKGTPVYVTGETGNSGKIEVAPADASDSAKMPALGILESTLNDNAEGFCVQGGLLEDLATATIDGTSTTANDTVYVKAGGGLTMTKPTGTGLIQNIAKVVRVHASNGSLVVSSILRTNDVPNLTTGKIWVGDGNTTESTVVHLNESLGRMGIGTDSPTLALDVRGTQGSPSSSGTSQTGSLSIRGGGSHFMSSGMLNVSPWTGWFQAQDANNLATTYPLALNPNGGNVGIGTDSPGVKLDVDGTARIKDYNDLILNGVSLKGYPNKNLWLIGNESTNVEYTIGTSWNWDLSVSFKYTPYTIGNETGFLQIGQLQKNSNDWTHGVTSFYVAGSEKMRITSAGGISFGSTGTAYGTSGQILKSNANASPTWVDASTVIGGPYVTIGTAQTITAAKTFTADVNVGAASTDGAGIHLIYSTTVPEIRIQAGENGASAFSIYNTATSPDAEQFFINNNLGSSHLGNARGALKLETSAGVNLTLSGSNATFAGTVTAPTFLGDLNGTINTATTGVTQTAGNNSTLIATTAYADAAAGAVPIGNYLPLAGGLMTGAGNITMPDNFELRAGTDSDLRIYNNGTNNFILNTVGNLNIRNTADDGNITFQSDDGSGGYTSYFLINGASEQTQVYKDFRFQDDVKAKFGNTEDLQIYHDGSNSFIQDAGTGFLVIDTNGTDVRITNTDNEFMAKFVTDAQVELYYNGSKKFETTSTGVSVTGDLTVTGDGNFTGTELQGDNKTMLRYSDSWLRINDDNDFVSGIYCGTGILRTDGDLQVGSSGTKFLVTSAGAVTAESTLTLDNGQIVLNGTGRIQGVDTVSDNTDAANKLYVDNAVSSHTHSASDITSGILDTARLPEFIEERYIYNSNDSNGVFMPMVKGGMYATTAGSVTGAIKVTLPSYQSNMMFTIYVDIYEYTTGETVTFRVSGYAYSDAGATWHNCSVVNLADNTDRNYTVRFYSDTTNNAQYFTIGETNSAWAYPQVNLRDFWGGYDTSESEALGEWNVEFVTSFTGDLRHTFADNFVAADWDGIRDKPSTFTPSSHNHDDRYYTETESDNRFVNVTGDTMTGNLGLNGVGTNSIINGTGDGANFTTYNFAISGWNGMAFYNPTSGGAYPNQVSGVVDFRNGTINMKGGFLANGLTVLSTGNYNSYAPSLTGSGASGSWGISITGNAANSQLLDNLDSTQFLRSDTNDTFTGNLTTGADNHITFGPNTTWGSYLRVGGNGRTATGTEMASVVTTDGNLHLDAADAANAIYLNYYAGTNGVMFGNGADGIVARMDAVGNLYKATSTSNVTATYWHSGNDGAGSGLDADLLDGQHASAFQPAGSYVTTDTIQTVSGAKTFSSTANHYSGHLYYDPYDANGNHYPHFNDGANGNGVNVNWRLYQGSNLITHGWSYSDTTFVNSLRSTVEMRAPIYYDSDDTGYYVDPASISNLSALSLTQYQYITGQTSNGQSHYQWDGATYRNPWEYTSRLIVRQDNTSTGINGSMPAIVLYNSRGGDQTTTSLVFASRETDGAGNTVNLAGIIAKKEGAGNNGAWSAGSLNFFVKDFGTRRDGMFIAQSGYVQSDYSFRSPIFYDSDNTAYYGDFASTSNFNALQTYSYQGNGNVGGTGAASWHPSGIYSAGFNWLYGGINAGGGSATNFGDVRANIFYDNQDTGYYLDPASGSQLRDIYYNAWLRNNNSSASGLYWESGSPGAGWHIYPANTTSMFMVSGGTSNGSLRLTVGNETTRNYLYWDTSSNVGFLSDAGAWIFRVDNSGNTFATTSHRAPIFYDSDNTAYYLDPASTSNLNNLTVNGTLTGTASGNLPINGKAADSELIDGIDSARIVFGIGASKINSQSDANSQVDSGFYENAGGGTNWPSATWYNSINVRHSNQGNYHGFQAAMSYYDNNFWFRSYQGSGTFQAWEHALSSGGGSQTKTGILQSNASFRAPIFYDSDNTSYYINPGSGANPSANLTGKIIVNTQAEALTVSTGYGTPSIGGYFGALYTSSPLYVGSPIGAGEDLYCDDLRSNIVFDRVATAYYFEGGNTGDSIRVAGDVVAYYSSDERLKDNIKPIENALQKVNAIRGVTFEWNEKSHKTTGKKDIGVVAQEIEAVLPELVETRTNGYKAVDYQKLTAVLIESVKELTAKVEALEAKQCNCK